MGQGGQVRTPEEIRHEIDQTRNALGEEVDLLTEKVSPGRIMERRVGRARGAMTSIRDRVMGSNSSHPKHAGSSDQGGVGSAMSSAAGTVSGTASSATSRVGDAASSASSTI